jgi:hypothetical protein
LIKLNKRVISGGKGEESPFFNRQSFERLLDRCVQTELFGHKKYDMKQAVEKKLIEHNIETTLDSLFANNKNFYINNKVYKIADYIWDEEWTLNGNRTGTSYYDERTDSSFLSVDVFLELYPSDKNLTMRKKTKVNCTIKYEKLRHSWAKMFGSVYRQSGFTID